MIISGCPFARMTRSVERALGEAAPAPRDGVVLSRGEDSPTLADMERLRAAARARSVDVTKARAGAQGSAGPTEASGDWGSPEALDAALASAVRNPLERVRGGAEAGAFDAHVGSEICAFQARKAEAEHGPATRLVHRQQLHGGRAELHWNPALQSRLQLFDQPSLEGVGRLSDADASANPDGKTMYGFALELRGTDGSPTDILLTGGTERTEASQARDAEAQLALFNMLHPTSILAGLGRIVRDVGLFAGSRMLLDVTRMKTELTSLTDLTAWSRAPFAVRDRNGDELLVKMRVRPGGAAPAGEVSGETSSQRLSADLASRLSQGEARWMLDFQFAQAGDDLQDGRATWGGAWVPAGEVVLPRSGEAAAERELAAAVDGMKFNPWKGKEPGSTAADRDTLRPWGELNRARLAAYAASAQGRS